MTQQILRGSAILRPRARMIRIIGRDLISNEVVALVELIKNAYDADATSVRLTFEDPLRPTEGQIVIEDDGIGMTLKTIKEAWFEPATVSKVHKTRTSRGRRVTGEKGIGRFAAARVAQAMEITSVAEGSRRAIRVRFDWGAFDDESLFLDEVRCKWEVSPIPKGRQHGTTLRLIGMNEVWDPTSFSRLRGELSRLIAPLDGKRDFAIELTLPERFKEYSGPITLPPILGKPHYKFTGTIDSLGNYHASYEGPDTHKPVIVSGTVRFERGRLPDSGPFRFEFRIWDRETSDLDPLAKELGSTVRKLREDLNAACGISIYRDDFRVLLADSDWLGLDLRRVQNPTLRISNNQIVGAVYISADENRGLRDQSSRQGIVSSSAFDDFRRTMVELLAVLERKRDDIRRGYRLPGSPSGLFRDLDLTPIRTYVEQRYPNDTELIAFLDNRSKAFEHSVTEVQQVLARYRRLATLGQLIDVVLHEGRTPVAAISNEAELALGDIKRVGDNPLDPGPMQKRIRAIGQQAEVLSGIFRRLAPFSGRKRGRPTRVTIERIISDTFALFEQRVKDLHVDVSLPRGETWVTVDESEMQQIFVNLLDNSLYWLDRKPDGHRKVAVEVSRRRDELVVIFSDNGPGVPEDVRDRIFDPYFSTKPDGVGLGLTIAGETAAEYDGALELVSTGPLPGANFRVILRTRIGT